MYHEDVSVINKIEFSARRELKYIFLAGKVIRTARSVVMKLYKGVKRCKMEEILLKLSEFRHNHHPSGVKMLANFTRCGIPVLP